MIKYKALQLPDIANNLAWLFDFNVVQTDEDISWIKLSPSQPFTLLATEGSGGVFLAYGNSTLEKCPILFASSEGQAGKIANNLEEFLSILMAIPYWFDLLKFSGNGDLTEMRKTALFMEQEYKAKYSELPDIRKQLIKKLKIKKLDDAISVLHNCIHETDCTLVADDGWKYESLFNSFTSSDNNNWA